MVSTASLYCGCEPHDGYNDSNRTTLNTTSTNHTRTRNVRSQTSSIQNALLQCSTVACRSQRCLAGITTDRKIHQKTYTQLASFAIFHFENSLSRESVITHKISFNWNNKQKSSPFVHFLERNIQQPLAPATQRFLGSAGYSSLERYIPKALATHKNRYPMHQRGLKKGEAQMIPDV